MQAKPLSNNIIYKKQRFFFFKSLLKNSIKVLFFTSANSYLIANNVFKPHYLLIKSNYFFNGSNFFFSRGLLKSLFNKKVSLLFFTNFFFKKIFFLWSECKLCFLQIKFFKKIFFLSFFKSFSFVSLLFLNPNKLKLKKKKFIKKWLKKKLNLI